MEDKSNAGNTAVESTESNVSPAKKTSKAKSVKLQRSKASHPPTSEMVNAAIKELKDRKGSSLQAIKKYIVSTYKVDGEKLAPFIKRYLKTAVTSGAVVQTKGKGASGSFKLSTGKGTSEPKAKVQKAVKPSEPKKAKKTSVEKKTKPARKSPATKKPSSAKKTTTEAKKSAPVKKAPAKAEKAEKIAKVEKSKPAAESKTMSKSKKTAKAPAAKTKTPRPKKAAASKAVKSAKK